MTHSLQNASEVAGTSTENARAASAQQALAAAVSVDADSVAFRRVDGVEGGHVILDMGTSTLAVPADALPPVEPGQWLKFTREGTKVRAEVDLAATLEAESRLAKLFTTLFSPTPRPSAA